jgi:ferric-dicitrate binding protein FerR (iron transport regulator)
MTVHTVKTVERDGRWFAYAERADTGSRFGIEVSGATEAEAAERMQRWLAWQQAHADALEALQRAEQAYYRTIAGSAFANPTEGPSALEMQKDALHAVEAARVALDEIRARKPE